MRVGQLSVPFEPVDEADIDGAEGHAGDADVAIEDEVDAVGSPDVLRGAGVVEDIKDVAVAVLGAVVVVVKDAPGFDADDDPGIELHYDLVGGPAIGVDDLNRRAPGWWEADCKGFSGAVDFLRVCRSTLAESKTTIDELFTWEFNGPALRDFTGRLPAAGQVRDAGAMAIGN